ncbi:MAG: hypothetical protein JEZ04_16430 [Spirochaetales bacterium]|nr:hypothetical protein [Spirochaetales bacterium]
MKKLFFTAILAFVLLTPAFSEQTGASFTIGNNNLTSAPLTGTEFPGTEFLWGGSLFWTKEANDQSGIEVGFTTDPVMKNLGYASFYYKEDLFSIDVGPFFGLFNTAEALIKSGIATSIRVNIPGIAFAEFATQSTIGGRLTSTGDYLQEANSISAGFYVYNAICTVMLDTKSFSRVDATLGIVNEDFTEYALVFDLFQKNIPYTAKLKLAFQQRVRTIAATNIQSLYNVVLGTDFSINPFEFLSIFLGIESGLYSFGYNEDTVATTKDMLTFASTFPGNFLFNATIGCSLDLDAFNN